MTNLIRSFSSSDLYSENQILWSTDLTNDIWFDAHAIKREIEDKVSPPENLPETGKVISIMDLPKCNLHLIGQRVENGSPEAKTVSVLVKHTEEGSKDFTIWATGGVQIAVFSRRDWSFISGVAISTGVEQCQGGWIRLSATFSVENNDIYFGTSEGKNSRYVGENKKQFYVYAPQYEWSESSTSYIPTLSQISCHPGKVTSGGFHSTINLLALLEDLVTSYQGSQSFFSLFKVAFQGFQHSRFFTFGLKLLHRALKAGKLSIEECVVLQEGLIKNAKNISSKDLIKYLASFTTTLFNDELPWQALELFQQQIHLFTPQFKGLSNAQVEGKVLVQDFKESIETEEYEKVWFILNCSSSQQTITSFKEYLKASKFDTDKVRDFCNSPGNSELEFLLLDGLKKDDEVRLSNLGLSYQLLNLVDLDDENLENILISLSQLKSKGTIIKRQYCYSQTRFSCWEPVNNPSTEFAFTVPEFKKIYTVDPFTGEILESRDSFVMGEDCIIYRFSGYYVFYLLVGQWHGGKLSIFIPQLNLVVILRRSIGNFRQPKPHLEIFEKFKKFALQNLEQFLNYIGNSERKIAVSIGFYPNLGHFFWQSGSGIYHLIENALLAEVDCFIVGSKEFLKLEKIFPELDEKTVFRDLSFSDDAYLFKFCLTNHLFTFRPTTHCIVNKYAHRVQQASRALCGTDFVEKLETLKRERWPLVWINLRSHNKVWTDQVSGFINIINELGQSWKNIGIVFDGWVDCEDIMLAIVAGLNEEIMCFPTLGCKLHESIVWAAYVDTYISVIGSGLVLTSWLNDKPGIAFGDKRHRHQSCFWSYAKEQSIPPIFLNDSEIVDHTDRFYSDYDIDWRILFRKISDILNTSIVRN